MGHGWLSENPDRMNLFPNFNFKNENHDFGGYILLKNKKICFGTANLDQKYGFRKKHFKMTSVFHIYDDFLKTKYNEHEVVHMLRDAGNFSNFWI